MSVREMQSPSVSVEPGENFTVRIRFAVLGSKFGPVYVALDTGEALALVEEIEAVVEALDALALTQATAPLSLPTSSSPPAPEPFEGG